MLTAVPVVGLKDNQIMYTQTTSADSVTPEVWSAFSSLPTGATINQGDKVFMFPYNGHFYLSIGKAVWKKACRDWKDPAVISSAVNDWPNLYVKEWQKLGDDILPAKDLAGIACFALLDTTLEVLNFHLVVLASDGTISSLTSDTLDHNPKFKQMDYSGPLLTPPKFHKIAYWNNNIIAVDSSSNTWKLTPSFFEGTYSASTDNEKFSGIDEFTATDAGLVELRSDGYLYRRLVQAPTKAGDDATLKWTRWIKGDGMKNLGVASPGVMLDLRRLTRSLRSKYLSVQASVYPVVNDILAFGETHYMYLEIVMEATKQYQAAGTDKEKQAIAIETAEFFIEHAEFWAMFVQPSVSSSKVTVNIMAKELKDVRQDIELQVENLRVKLEGLQATLKAQEEEMSQLKAAFWGAVAAAFLGRSFSFWVIMFKVTPKFPLLTVLPRHRDSRRGCNYIQPLGYVCRRGSLFGRSHCWSGTPRPGCRSCGNNSIHEDRDPNGE